MSQREEVFLHEFILYFFFAKDIVLVDYLENSKAVNAEYCTNLVNE